MRKRKVKLLQRSLKVLGFRITVDGVYGIGTQSTLKLFQKSRKLKPDGLYGKNTSKSLKKSVKFKVFRSIRKECIVQGITNSKQVSYIFATLAHETAHTWLPIKEIGSKRYISRRYDPVLATTSWRRNRAKKMGNTRRGDGWKYRGRGFIQLTWKLNYKRFTKLLSKRFNKKIDLVRYPNLALDLEYSIYIIVYGMKHGIYTGKKLSDYISGNKVDFKRARRIVNGNDKAIQIARLAKSYSNIV